jgi:hypothetical protein
VTVEVDDGCGARVQNLGPANVPALSEAVGSHAVEQPLPMDFVISVAKVGDNQPGVSVRGHEEVREAEVVQDVIMDASVAYEG